MANAVITVLEADGTTQTDVTVLDVGRQAAAASKSIATCTEDKAVLDAIQTAVQLIDNTVYVEDAAAASDPSGNMMMAVRRDTLSASEVSSDGDNIALKADNAGRLHVLAKIDSTQVDAVAHDAADSGSPAKIGGYASTTPPTAVSAAGDRVNAWFTLNGAAVVAGQGFSASATFTPAASSHAAGDCNGAAAEIDFNAPSGSRIMITSASLEIDGGTAEATAWRLYLFNVTPPSAVADDSPFVLPSGDRASFLGQIDLGTATDMTPANGDTQWVETHGINKQIKLAGDSVFAYLVNLTTLTPANVAHIVTLHAVAV